MKNPFKHFEANTKGRDFVIGDLHGSYEVFLNLLENINFDGEVDRMFSVGDLIDRGPDSELCLYLNQQPWFHSVLANHEQMMLEAFDGGYIGQFWLKNGGMWGIEHLQNWVDYKRNLPNGNADEVCPQKSKDFFKLIEEIRELPFLITVDLLDGTKVHIIHAELPPNFLPLLSDSDLSSPGKLMDIATVQSNDGDFLVWGRHKFYRFHDTELTNHAKNVRTVANLYPGHKINDKLSKIISGHTILHRPMTILGQTNIDTKAYGSYPNAYGSRKDWCALTCVELNTWKFYQAGPDFFRETTPEVVNSSDLINLKDQNGNG